MKRHVLTAVLFACGGTLSSEETSVSKSFKLTQQSVTHSFSMPPNAATVNGAVISMDEFIQTLMHAAGANVLNAMVDEVLIEQEGVKTLGSNSPGKKSRAQKKLDAQAKTRIQEIKKRFPNDTAFLDELARSRMNLERLQKQVRLEILREKLLEKKTAVSGEEIREYFDANKERIGKPHLDPETKSMIAQALKSSKVSQEYPSYIQSLRSKADIRRYLNP